MIHLDADEQREFELLKRMHGDSDATRMMAVRVVAHDRRRQKIRDLEALGPRARMTQVVKAELGWKEKLAAWLLLRWAKENGMGFLGKVLRVEYFSGQRMYAAGVAAILGGLTLVALYIAGDPRGDLKEGWIAIVGGLAILGKAGKDEKQLQATTAVAVATAAANPDIRDVTAEDAQKAIAALPPVKPE